MKSALALFAISKNHDVLASQYAVGALPVQLQETLIGRLQEHVGQVFPQRQGRRIGEQTLAKYGFGTGEVTRQYELDAEFVSEVRDCFDHFVDDRSRKGPGEVARRLSGKGRARRKVQSSPTQDDGFSLGYLSRLVEQTLELHPVGGEAPELVAHPPRRGRQVTFANGLSCVNHVVAHGGLLDVGASIGERPDCGLNLFECLGSISVHCEIGHDRPHWITRQGVNRGNRQWSENGDAKRGLFSNDLPRRWHFRGRSWLGCLLKVTGWRLRDWWATHDVDRYGTIFAPPSTSNQEDNSTENSGKNSAEKIQHVSEGRTGRCHHFFGRRQRYGQLLRERQSNVGRSSDVQGHRRESREVVILHTGRLSWRDNQSATTIRDRHCEVVGRVNKAVVSRAIEVVRLIDWINPRHRVATARSRGVAQGRSGQWRHARKEVAPQWISVIALNGARTHLQRQVDFALWCVQVLIQGVCGVKDRFRKEQDAGQRGFVDGVGNGDPVTLPEGINGALLEVTGTCRRCPRKRHDNTEPERECCAVQS